MTASAVTRLRLLCEKCERHHAALETQAPVSGIAYWKCKCGHYNSLDLSKVVR